MILAAICEFLGAVLAGARVAGTIKSNIIDLTLFENDPAVLMLTMCCALVGSATWMSIATSFGMPVSTTHAIVGGTIGAGIAAGGSGAVVWGWDGVSQIIASWFIAPVLCGCIAAIVFLISKFSVLKIRPLERSIKNALILVGFFVFATFSVLTMLIVWKGSPNLNLNDLSGQTTALAIVLTGLVATAVYFLFFYPFYRRKLLSNDWTLKHYQLLVGPTLFFKSTDNIPPMPENHQLTIDYYEGRRVEESTVSSLSVYDQETQIQSHHSGSGEGSLNDIKEVNTKEPINESIDILKMETHVEEKVSNKKLWWSLLKQGPKKWPRLCWLLLSHGWTQDVIGSQVNSNDALSGDLKGMYQRSEFYDNKLEYVYSVLQAVTAGTMSFAHGANDMANATGPLSAVYGIWKTNTVQKKSDVPVWILAYGGVCLIIGVWTFGYKVIRNLGNKLILQSPSRGFSSEFAAAITTVMATQLSIPVSTTQVATGGIVAVGLCNKDLRSVNWRMVAFCYLGWILTLPIAGLVAGILNAIILNAPHWGGDYQLS